MEGGEGVQRLLSEIRVIAPFIHTLYLTRLPSHVDLSLLLRPCPRLSSLHCRFGSTQLHMDWDPSLLGMTREDAQALARLLLHTSSLISLCLPCTILTDVLYPSLHLGLASTPSLTHLDLSHNALSDQSIVALAALLPTSLLTLLDVSDNSFGAVGAKALGAGVRGRGARGGPLELRVGGNRVGWEGVEGVMGEVEEGRGEVIGVLDIVACGVGREGRDGLVRTVKGRGGRGVRELYAACNQWVGGVGGGVGEEKEGGDEGEDLIAAVKENKALLVLDVSMCGWHEGVLQRVQGILDGRIEADKASKRRGEGRK